MEELIYNLFFFVHEGFRKGFFFFGKGYIVKLWSLESNRYHTLEYY